MQEGHLVKSQGGRHQVRLGHIWHRSGPRETPRAANLRYVQFSSIYEGFQVPCGLKPYFNDSECMGSREIHRHERFKVEYFRESVLNEINSFFLKTGPLEPSRPIAVSDCEDISFIEAQ